MAERTLFVSGKRTLSSCFDEAGCARGDHLVLCGVGRAGAEVYSSATPRVLLDALTVEDCTLDVGTGVWFLGHKNHPCEMRIRRSWVRGPGSSKSTQDVFMSCRLAEIVDCRWTGTLNGPVGAERVERVAFDDIRSDVLSGCLSVSECVVGRVTGGGGAHPDVHQIFAPGWTGDREAFGVDLRGLSVGEAGHCNGQYLHWTVLGTGSSPGRLSARVTDCVFGDRPSGEVWSSRILVDCESLEWRGVRFGQPLHLGMRRLDRGVFERCDFRKGIYAPDAATRSLLDRCEWVDVTVGSITGPGVYVPPNAKVVLP